MSNFNIENGVLKKYTGKDADVVIPDGVTEIGDYAFSYCSSLTSITIPDSVTKIGDWAFSGCSGLTSITIPDSLTEIGDRAFDSCRSITSITIPDSVTEIDDWAFCDCSGLTSITIPDSVTKIGEGAFYGCTGLASVTIPDSVTKIDKCAFEDCSGLTSVTIPDSVTKIGAWAFCGCTGLTSVTIPDSVTIICDCAFRGCSSLTSVTIPDSVKKIGESAFEYCRRLKSVTISDSVTEIGGLAFSECKGLIYNEYDNALYLGNDNNPYLVLIKAKDRSIVNNVVNDRTKIIYHGAFSDCRRLKSITIPDSVTEIGNWTFDGCTGLTSITIPDSVTKIGWSAFSGCSSLTSVTIPDGVTKIGDWAFLYCTGLTSVTIPDGVTKIGKSAFEDCRRLKSVTIPESVTEIGEDAFSGCKLLKTVVLPAGKDLLWFAEEAGNCYPLCYTATEEQMADAIKEAAKWKKDKKEAFYEAYLVSDTRAAMLLAEKRKELDKYAKRRRMTADEVRDSMLSDLGLDAEGCKSYDLGNMTVNVRMLSDFTFTVELPDGKTSKSIPKKGADEKKYEEANKDFSEIKKNVKKIWKNRSDVILSDFITGKEREASYWIKTYSGNPVLRHIACLIVWEQNGAYFTKTKDGTVDADGAPYELGEGTVRVAHPMEMSAEEVTAWQKYFTDRVLKQPFAQIWERVYKPEDISEDRYRDCPILFFALQGAGKHGFDEKLEIPGCKVETNWTSEKAPNGNSISYCNIMSFRIEKYSRAVNHAIAYLDRTTVLGRIAKDDISVMDSVQGCNAAQITDYTDAANNAKATNVLAALLEYKNKNFPDATPFDVFTLDW